MRREMMLQAELPRLYEVCFGFTIYTLMGSGCVIVHGLSLPPKGSLLLERLPAQFPTILTLETMRSIRRRD